MVATCAWLGGTLFVKILGGLVRTMAESLPPEAVQFTGLAAWLVSPHAYLAVLLLPPVVVGLFVWGFRNGLLKAERLPAGLGEFVRTQKAIWIGRVLGQLLEAGLTVTHSLTLAAQVGYSAELEATRTRLAEGETLAQSFPEGFPSLLTTMTAAGEEAGKIPVLLQKACDILELEWDLQVERWMALVEPAILVMFALCAVFVVSTVAGPMGQAMQSLL